MPAKGTQAAINSGEIALSSMSRWLACAACAVAALFAPTSACARGDAGVRWRASVTYVVDGDSIWVRSASGERVRLRLEGIDAPEICQPSGEQARQAMQALALDQKVWVTVRAHDVYGRAIARVVRARDRVDVARQMVREGWAWADRFHGKRSRYGRDESAARAAGRGLFAQPRPEWPGDFRKRHGPCKG
jgi:endonuclease YncB( thermonuclease family)